MNMLRGGMLEVKNAISKMIMESMSVLERNTYQNINIHREQEKKSGQNQGEDSQCLVNDILLCLANNNYVWKRLTIHDRAFFPVAIAALIVNRPGSYERIDCTRLMWILGFKKQSQMGER